MSKTDAEKTKMVEMMNQMKNVATTNNVGEVDCLRRISSFLRTGFKDDNGSEDKFAHMLAEWTQNYFVTNAALNPRIFEIISDALLFKFNSSDNVRILNCTGLHLYQGLTILNEGHDKSGENRFAGFLRKLKSNNFTKHSYVFTFPVNDKGTGLDAKAEGISKSCTLSAITQQAEGSLLQFYANLKKNGDHPVLLFEEELKKGELAQKGISKPVDFVLDGNLPLLLQRDSDVTTGDHFETHAVPSCFWDVSFVVGMSREKFQALGPRLDTMGILEIVDDGAGELTLTLSSFLCYLSFMLRMTTYLVCAQPILDVLKEPELKSLVHVQYDAPKKDVAGMLEKQSKFLQERQKAQRAQPGYAEEDNEDE
jgi:hypothetical protein